MLTGTGSLRLINISQVYAAKRALENGVQIHVLGVPYIVVTMECDLDRGTGFAQLMPIVDVEPQPSMVKK
jgi:hypothetical protein